MMMMMMMMIVESKSVSHGGGGENRRGVGGIVHHSLSAHHPDYLSPDGRTQRPAAVRHIQLVLPCRSVVVVAPIRVEILSS